MWRFIIYQLQAASSNWKILYFDLRTAVQWEYKSNLRPCSEITSHKRATILIEGVEQYIFISSEERTKKKGPRLWLFFYGKNLMVCENSLKYKSLEPTLGFVILFRGDWWRTDKHLIIVNDRWLSEPIHEQCFTALCLAA